MFSDGNIERTHTKKRLLDDGRTGSALGVNSIKKMPSGANGSPIYENQNLAYMDQESMMSFQRGQSILAQLPILDTSLGNQP